jgi:hypothetical protein
MKTLKISEDLHQSIKKYCADNSKNVQDIVEDKLSELVHKEFNIGSLQMIGSDNTVTLQIEKDSLVTLMELFKKLVLNKPLDNVDIITDLIKSIKYLEDFVEAYNVQDKAKKADEKAVKEFFDSEKSHLHNLKEEMIKTLEESEKEKEGVISEEITKNINEVAKQPSEVVEKSEKPVYNHLSEDSIRMVANSIGIKDENDYENLKNKLLFDAKSVSGDYDVQVDGTYYDISEIKEDTKIVILKNHEREKSVDAYSLFESMNPSSSSFKENIESIKKMFNVLTLPQHLDVFENYNDLPLTTCNWIYTLNGSNRINYMISKQDDFYIHVKDNTIDIISRESKDYKDFVQPHLLPKFYEGMGV